MQDFLMYLKLGWEHIISLDALDHQLFILTLIVIYSFYDLKKILILITAFTVGHSLTLALSLLDMIRIPSNWVEFLIALTIVITALDNIFTRKKSLGFLKFNYFTTLCFGLIHGMGFANLARVALAKEQSIAIPLLGFNLGLELGQIVMVIVFLIVSFIITNIFRVPKKDWQLFVSSGVFALALQMVLERLPY